MQCEVGFVYPSPNRGTISTVLRLLERLLPRTSRTSRSLGVSCIVRFPDSTELRWFDNLPIPGTRIRTHAWDPRLSKFWVVDEVLQSGSRTYTVFCVGREEYIDKLRHGSGDKPDVATELLEVARRTRETVSEGRHRWKYRKYLP
jgi:hypothetical protein